jgi:energy-converting hydrogenase Eha subunit B
MKSILLFPLILSSSILFSQPLQENEINAPHTEQITKIESDTITALNKLFQRKRNANNAGAVIFGALTVSSVVAGVDSGLAGNFLIAGIFGIFTISNISKATKKYSSERLEQIIKDFQNGKPLPHDIKKKLKKKDFL